MSSTQHDRAWHEARLEGFGGTDAPVLLGLSRWQTARDVVEKKIRRIIPDLEQPERLRFRIGKELEPILIRHAGELALERGLIGPAATNLRRSSRQYSMPGFGFVQAHPDGFFGDAMIELKTDAWGFEPWGDEEGDPTRVVPPMYYAQVQHELAATGRGRGLLFVLIGLGDRKLYLIPRDDDFIGDLVEVERPLWDAVLEGRRRLDLDPDAEIDDLLPDLDGSASATAWLKKRYPHAGDEVILPATAEQEQVIAQLRDAIAQAKKGETFVEQLKNRLKEIIGAHAGISSSAGTITWRQNVASSSIAWELVARAYRKIIEDELQKVLSGDYAVSQLVLPGTFEPVTFEALDALESLHMTKSEGARVFRTPRGWTKNGDD